MQASEFPDFASAKTACVMSPASYRWYSYDGNKPNAYLDSLKVVGAQGVTSL
jgi:hypothetical protein